MSLRSRVIYWLRGELDAVFGLPVGRGHADLAEGAGQHLDPVLVRYYATLELPHGSGLDRVSRTWRRLVKKSNPDLYSADEDKKGIATDLVQRLNRAYEELARHLERK